MTAKEVRDVIKKLDKSRVVITTIRANMLDNENENIAIVLECVSDNLTDTIVLLEKYLEEKVNEI